MCTKKIKLVGPVVFTISSGPGVGPVMHTLTHSLTYTITLSPSSLHLAGIKRGHPDWWRLQTELKNQHTALVSPLTSAMNPTTVGLSNGLVS